MLPPLELGFKLFRRLMVHVAVPSNIVDFSRPIRSVNAFHMRFPFFAASEENKRFCALRKETDVRLKVLV